MKIALITDGIWPYVLGGMQKHSYYLCKYLAQKKVEVDLYHYNSSSYDINKLEFFSEEEKKYIRSTVIPFPQGLKFPGHYLFRSYQYSLAIFNQIKDKLNDYHFIYTKGFSGWYLINQKHSGKINCPLIGVKFHGYEMFQKAPDFTIKIQQLLLLRRPVKLISQRADRVFSYGGKITDIIKSIGVEEKNIIELPSGVEESFIIKEIKPVGNVLRFLFLGRYERRKGIEELNTAIYNLITENKLPNAEFHFVGPIPEEKKINQKRVIYHGEIRDKQLLREKITACDILICPSWSEGMPNVILEAMACGLCVIATDVGATNVMVNQNTGWVLNTCSPNEIETAIKTACAAEAQVILKKKEASLELIKNNLVWEKLIDRLLKNWS